MIADTTFGTPNNSLMLITPTCSLRLTIPVKGPKLVRGPIREPLHRMVAVAEQQNRFSIITDGLPEADRSQVIIAMSDLMKNEDGHGIARQRLPICLVEKAVVQQPILSWRREAHGEAVRPLLGEEFGNADN